ncbi:hypothetical protein M2D07_009015 [Pseudomonas sp. BGr12]|uniref:hypothetical protein n=1 Tax=unclassified Pseudomonas TaxID=196821 RepID=UPI001784136B|nr:MULTISPECIES: hypothetical protein [unclassified Pseudomonas]MBD9501538.1 hypothetical protein [Pseudomonas sp. PDM17]MDL2427156.1 hypothetical protein [Pseudomonas sp. BJa5]
MARVVKAKSCAGAIQRQSPPASLSAWSAVVVGIFFSSLGFLLHSWRSRPYPQA